MEIGIAEIQTIRIEIAQIKPAQIYPAQVAFLPFGAPGVELLHLFITQELIHLILRNLWLFRHVNPLVTRGWSNSPYR